jgi:hypothetical protein
MDTLITGLVDHTIVPIGDAIGWAATHGVLLLGFAALWVAFGAALVFSQGSLDDAWAALRGLPLLVQGVVALLFLPVVAGLWVWETSWPLIVRLVLVLGLGGWNILVFLPRTAGD